MGSYELLSWSTNSPPIIETDGTEDNANGPNQSLWILINFFQFALKVDLQDRQCS
jgi:hypothetical protein